MRLEEIREMAERLYPKLVEIRRYLHSNPELGATEYNTQNYIIEQLAQEGIVCEKIADTGVVVTIQGKGSGKVVGLRGDIDALPITEQSKTSYCSKNLGVMHACGHDAHTTILIGVGLLFHRMRDQFDGVIKLFFQPAEETIGGADRMVKEGCLKNPEVDYVIGLHVMPYMENGNIEIKYGTLNASTDTMTFVVKGKGGHGAYPEQGIDAIAIAAQMVVATQTVVSRSISPLDSAVLTYGTIQGGTKSNIIADEVKLVATVRSSNLEVRKTMIEKVSTIARGTVEGMGGELEISLADDGYPSLVNNDQVVDVVKVAAIEVVGPTHIFEKKSASMGGEDFSFFIKDVPGAFYHLGCKIAQREDYNIHTNQFDIDEECLVTGVVMQAWTALKLMK